MLNVANISKLQGGETLYSKVNFQINPGEKVGLVGANGSGKSTLFRMIIGEERADEGQSQEESPHRGAHAPDRQS